MCTVKDQTSGLLMVAFHVILSFNLVIVEQGRIFRDLRLPGLSAPERTALYVAAVETLAKLHSLDLKTLNLEGYGKGPGYCKRQVTLNIFHDKDTHSHRRPQSSPDLSDSDMLLHPHRSPPGRSSTPRQLTETFRP